MGLVARKPVFGISEKASFKPVSSATGTSQKIEISPVASLMWYFPQSEKQRRWSDCADAQAGLPLCCSQTSEDRFSHIEAHIVLSL